MNMKNYPTRRKYPAQMVNSAEANKPWPGIITGIHCPLEKGISEMLRI